MKQEKIGIDLDDTIIDFINPLAHFAQAEGIPLFPSKIKSYNFWEAWSNGTKEQAMQLVERFFQFSRANEMPPIKDAISSIEKLSSLYDIAFITSRFGAGKHHAARWLKNHFSNISYQLFFAGRYADNNLSKSDICRENNIAILIDDFHEYVQESVEENSQLVGIIFGNYGWTRRINHPRIKAAATWAEVLEHLNYVK